MASEPAIQWSDRVKPGKVRRLYNLDKVGLYDEALLIEVGWGLYARCRDVLTVWQAVCKGELPCPQCGEPVYRPRHEKQARRSRSRAGGRAFRCPSCGRSLTWRQCRDALRRTPKCFDCLTPLRWRYAENHLECGHCGQEWSWQEYLRSVTARVWLPCPHCIKKIRRPERAAGQITKKANGDHERVECPQCGGAAVHAHGKLACGRCGYEVAWSRYRRRMKRRVERLECSSCGYAFTWELWRAGYVNRNLLTGRPAPLREFVSAWVRCKAPQQQMIQTDGLLHAVHGRGALGPLLIEGDEESVMEFLDDLAQ